MAYKFNREVSSPQFKKILVIILALAVACALWIWQVSFIKSHQSFEYALVVNKNIPAYSKISKDDLEYVRVPVGGIEQDSATEPDQVIGKYAKDELFAGRQIDLNRIAIYPVNLGNRELIAVKTDFVLSVGGLVIPGDHVDAYVGVGSGNSSISKLVATDAIVVSVENANGQDIYNTPYNVGKSINSTLMGEPSNNNAPGIVVLAINPSDVQNAYVLSNSTVVLVKIFDQYQQY